MPSSAEHRNKAEANEFFVQNTGNPFFDWSITGIFYAALHYVDAYLATIGIHPPSHAVRVSQVQRDPELSKIYVDYRELLNESRAARYEPPVTFTAADVARLGRVLVTIKKVILPHI